MRAQIAADTGHVAEATQLSQNAARVFAPPNGDIYLIDWARRLRLQVQPHH